LSSANAEPIDDKRAQAAQLQAQIDANGRKIDSLSEAANGARYRLDQATAARDDAQARIDAAKAETTRLRGLLRGRALNVYKGAGSQSPLDAIDVSDARALAARSKYAAAAASSQNKLVDQLRSAKEELDARKQEFESAIEQAKSEQQRVEAARSEIETANAKQAQLLGQVKGELASLVAQEEQRKQAEAAVRARAMTAPRPSPARSGASGDAGSGGGNSWSGPLPSASGGAAAAIAFARAQLGKPYVFAAAGPDAFDCSGLTMAAWRSAGVSMDHYSGSQATHFPKVSWDQLQPGDILVFYADFHHVGLYIGGGQMIHAPHTGDVVRIATAWRTEFQFGVRPG
jgi:cell wall-associated NlpC family hydrolase